MLDDAAIGFGRSASLEAAGAEGAEPCATTASNTRLKHTTVILLRSHLIHTSLHALYRVFRIRFSLRIRL